MDAKQLRIIFMGTPEFAVPSLRMLVDRGYDVVAVVTVPDKPAGRGQKLRESEVKTAARELGLPLLQPERLKAPEFVESLRKLRPDLGIVIAFRMLPEVVWSMPTLGTFNLHASLLPQYRGAAPINRAIMNGERETGLTTFLLNPEIDKGAILRQVRMPILPEDDFGTLHDKLMLAGPELVCDTVDRLAAGNVEPLTQDAFDEASLRTAPKIFREECRIDWSQPGRRIVDFIRGLSPHPAAWSELEHPNGTIDTVKIYGAEFVPTTGGEPSGSIDTNGRTSLGVACADGAIAIRSIQMAGKRRMDIREALAGWRDVSDCRFR